MASEATTEAVSDGKARRLANLKPWPKGVNGRTAKRNELLADEHVHFVQHHGREPAHPERLLIDELLSVRLKKPADATEATKRATSTAKLIALLYGLPDGGKAEPVHTPLRELLALDLEGPPP
jgi:hypothetical protein